MNLPKSRVRSSKQAARTRRTWRDGAPLADRVSRTPRDILAGAVAALALLASGCWDTLSVLQPMESDGEDAGKCSSEAKCGGDCEPCGLGEQCTRNSDCESRVCNGTCLPAGCRNEVKDEGETDVDCGGSCDPCEDGKRCEQDPHCMSDVCEEGRCQEPTCEDEKKNADESDVDCGGEQCDACGNGLDCREAGDCASSFCDEDVCADPGCGDGSLNGSETDLDCGGDCEGCDVDQRCASDSDCASRHCAEDDEGELRCVAADCDDDRSNGDESDVDCGGDCDPCDDGARCNDGSDCESLVCGAEGDVLTCLAASCDDERRNGGETGVDCGGENDCARCAAGEVCAGHADCATNSCDDDVCQEASCDDGRLNQEEIAVDCGGECDGCPIGTACSDPEDCRSGRCDSVCQKGGANTQCMTGDECLSGECNPSGCAAGSAGVACYDNVDCLSNVCGEDETCRLSGVDKACRADSDCASGRCDESEGICLPSQFVIETDQKNPTDQQVDFFFWVNRGANDPARAWQDVAFLYFFTTNQHSDFVGRYYGAGPNQTQKDSRFLAREVSSSQWAIIWRAIEGNTTLVPTTPMANPIDFQLHDEPAQSFDDTEHFSFQSGAKVPNSRIVLCQRVGGVWVHTQGQAPEFASEPCELVVDTCPADDDAVCDVLERRD